MSDSQPKSITAYENHAPDYQEQNLPGLGE